MKSAPLFPRRYETIMPTGTTPKKLAAQTRKNIDFMREKIRELSRPWQDIDNSLVASEAALMKAFDQFVEDLEGTVAWLEENAP